ncbi:hypothetical protein GFS31_43690 (plasmid) [Leptolyngbya sp. BL0902]|nr:hypothetical protein GFS31_43690 [Leptolyngbya sp. BL0902]
MDWSQVAQALTVEHQVFQSLRGFGVDWSCLENPCPLADCPVSIPERVWGGLELLLGGNPFIIHLVSIPERVWGGLERFRHGCRIRIVSVSIPERVWGGLEPAKTVGAILGKVAFQSLRGFGVDWSRPLHRSFTVQVGSFNP